jgi:sugar lactone lactonase YvrE
VSIQTASAVFSARDSAFEAVLGERPRLELVAQTDAHEGPCYGLKLDRSGNLYVCGPGGVWVLSAQGERLGLLGLPEAPHNLAWGDEDARTLYVTALSSVYRVRLGIPGIRPT